MLAKVHYLRNLQRRSITDTDEASRQKRGLIAESQWRVSIASHVIIGVSYCRLSPVAKLEKSFRWSEMRQLYAKLAFGDDE